MESPNFTPSAEMLKLEAYISTKKHGDFITYAEIIEALNIDIRLQENRGKFYRACKRLGRECANKPRYGYQLSFPGLALPIVHTKGRRIVTAGIRMSRAAKNVKTMHSDDLTNSQIAVIDNAITVGHAISSTANNLRTIIRKEHVAITQPDPK